MPSSGDAILIKDGFFAPRSSKLLIRNPSVDRFDTDAGLEWTRCSLAF